jgi:hypothetical protein
MNHPMPARDRSHRGADPGGPSRFARTVPCSGGLVGGVAAAVEEWPLLGHGWPTRVRAASAWRRGQCWEGAVSGEKWVIGRA